MVVVKNAKLCGLNNSYSRTGRKNGKGCTNKRFFPFYLEF